MTEITIKLPDIGEGIAEAEISEWLVEPGAWVQEDDPLVAVLTDKAAVEIPSSVSGKLVWRAGEPGRMLAVGAPLVRIEVAGDDAPGEAAGIAPPEPESAPKTTAPAPAAATPKPARARALAAPAVRRRAADLGIDLSHLDGTGPEGRILHADLDRYLAGAARSDARAPGEPEKIEVIGLRRRIAEQLAMSHARIPQITIVEEVDVTELERLRGRMNAGRDPGQPKLTLLPFLIRGLVAARAAAPQVNARYDDEAGVLHRFDALHLGVATQTDRGLIVPVLRHAEAASVWHLAAEIARLAEAARAGTIARAELEGATLTLTSLGPLGAVATTPLVNHPQVAIVGVNRKQVRPLWDGQHFAPREVMNLSASFDHRIVDGWDAAVFVARLKELIETPALLFA